MELAGTILPPRLYEVLLRKRVDDGATRMRAITQKIIIPVLCLAENFAILRNDDSNMQILRAIGRIKLKFFS